MQLPAARPQGGGCRDGRPCDLFLRDFFCLRQKKPLRLQRRPTAAGNCAARPTVGSLSVDRAQPIASLSQPGFASLAPLAVGRLYVSAASVSEAVHGRPSCAWMQRSAPHQRMTSVSEARSASASRRSLGVFLWGATPVSLGKTKEIGWHMGLAGPRPAQSPPARESAKACESAVRVRSSSSMSCAPATARWCVQRPGAASTAMATRIRRSGAGSTSESST